MNSPAIPAVKRINNGLSNCVNVKQRGQEVWNPGVALEKRRPNEVEDAIRQTNSRRVVPMDQLNLQALLNAIHVSFKSARGIQYVLW